jgi:hypothetical protein
MANVTLTSLGQNTQAIYCSDNSSNTTSNIGSTIQCKKGASVVAETDGNESQTVIRTLDE